MTVLQIQCHTSRRSIDGRPSGFSPRIEARRKFVPGSFQELAETHTHRTSCSYWVCGVIAVPVLEETLTPFMSVSNRLRYKRKEVESHDYKRFK